MNFFLRASFSIFSGLVFGAAFVELMPTEPFFSIFLIGILAGFIFSGALFLLSFLLKELNVRHLNTLALGLFFGGFLGYVILQIFQSIVEITSLNPLAPIFIFIKAAVYLASLYFGVFFTAQAAEEIQFSIPFFKFSPSEKKKKDVLLDPALLSDSRLIDLAKSGLLDHRLLIPGFAIDDLRLAAESSNEKTRINAQELLENYKKLDTLPDLELRTIKSSFENTKDLQQKLVLIARHENANILTSDIGKLQQSEIEDLKVININLLSHALKPLASSGEHIQIKIQRFGKEPRQGVGYLDDGTMVVVNGAAEFIGKTIKAAVLSVKPTTSGKIIFCNSVDLPMHINHVIERSHDLESVHSTYY